MAGALGRTVQRLASRPALVAFVLAVLASEALGEVPPLSRLPMYAALDASRTTAVLSMRVDGRVVDPTSLDRFTGEALLSLPWPERVPCTMRWFRDETRAYVSAHAGDHDGPLVVQWGYVLVGWREGSVGELGAFVPLAEGHAWPR